MSVKKLETFFNINYSYPNEFLNTILYDINYAFIKYNDTKTWGNNDPEIITNIKNIMKLILKLNPNLNPILKI